MDGGWGALARKWNREEKISPQRTQRAQRAEKRGPTLYAKDAERAGHRLTGWARVQTLSYIGCGGRRREYSGWPGQEYGSKDPQLHFVRRKTPGIFRMAWARVRI